MSDTNVRVLDQTVHLTNQWLKDLEQDLGDRQRSYQALRAVLHAIRDRLTADEAAHLSAQLPLLVRGVFYEGWHPAGVPVKLRQVEDFLDRIREEFPDGDADGAARAVFRVLNERISAGEIQDVRQMLPEGVRRLWPEPVGGAR
jgi:uncharacterized protein (DUF2267 family)